MKNTETAFTLILMLALTGCGGGGNQAQAPAANPPGDPVIAIQPPYPVQPNQPAGFWSGIIALRHPIEKSYNSAKLWYITTQEKKVISEEAYLYGSLRWSPDGNFLAYQDKNWNLIIRDRNGAIENSLEGFTNNTPFWLNDSSGLLDTTFRSSRGLYFFPIQGKAKLLNTYACNPVLSLDGKWIFFQSSFGLYRSDSGQFLSGGGSPENDLLWWFDTADREVVQLVPTANGKIIVAFQSTIWLIDPETKARWHIFQSLDSARLSSDGRYLATKYWDAVKILNPETLVTVWSIPNGKDELIKTFAWAPDGSALAIAAENMYSASVVVYLWHLSDQRLEKIFESSIAKPQVSTMGAVYGEQDYSISWAP